MNLYDFDDKEKKELRAENKRLREVIAKQNRIIKELRVAKVDEWKGKDEMEVIGSDEEGYVVITHQKNEDRDVITTEHSVTPEAVKTLWNILRKREKWVAGDVWRELIKAYDIGDKVTRESYNGGGGNRAKYYFPQYYYPVHVIHSQGLIEYSKSGRITVLKGDTNVRQGTSQKK